VKQNKKPTVVGLGEALFDVFPDRKILGGAPLNVAVMAHQLLAPLGGRGIVASRIGWDDNGDALLRELANRKMSTSYLQPNSGHRTGEVQVEIVEGEPKYHIIEDVAWDYLEFGDRLQSLAGSCDAVCFGTLAQRSPASRQAIHLFLEAARQAIRLFDVNLRQKYYSTGVLMQSCRQATWLKLNEAELEGVSRELDFVKKVTGSPSPETLIPLFLSEYALDGVALTRGRKGTLLFTREGSFTSEPVRYEPQPGADPVGAGDACSAGLLVGLLLNWPLEEVARLANTMGAFVASRPGATPQLPREIVRLASGESG